MDRRRAASTGDIRMRPTRIAIAAGGLILLMNSAPARAQETVEEAAVVTGGGPFSPLFNGVLADPLFLPAKGRLYGSGTSSLALATSDAFDATGAKLYARDRHDIGLSHGLAYGLTPHLSLHGSLGYSFNFADDTAPNGVVSKSAGRSFDNSAVGLSWRALDQRRHPFVLDLSLNYSPTFFLRDPGLRQAVNASVGVGRALRALTVQLIGNATWRPTQRFVSDDGRTDIEQRQTVDYTVALRTQFRFSPALATDTSVNYALNADRLTIDRAHDLSSGEAQPSTLTLSTGLAWQLIPNRIALGAYYSRQLQGDSRRASSDPSQDVFTRNGSRHVISGKIFYVIN